MAMGMSQPLLSLFYLSVRHRMLVEAACPLLPFLSLVMVPLSTEAAGSGEIQALSVAAANVTSKRKQTTAARSHIIQCCGKEEQEQWLC
jgi:hypothetical protein